MKLAGSIAKDALIKILYVVMIPILIYDVFLIAQTIIKPDDTPSIFGIKTFSIISGSMEPALSINDIVLIKEVSASELKINDIISFKIDGEVITHRILNVEIENSEYTYTTKGDSNDVADLKKIKYNQVEGKYIGKIPKMGKIFGYLKNETVFIIILTILILSYVHQKNKLSRKIERKGKRRKWERNELAKSLTNEDMRKN